MEDINKTIHSVCECGDHVLQTNCFLEFHDDNKRYHQEWNLAMFNHSSMGKPSIWNRMKTAWRYLRTGEMHNDQIILDEDEIEKLADFIKANNYAKCIEDKP